VKSVKRDCSFTVVQNVFTCSWVCTPFSSHF